MRPLKLDDMNPDLRRRVEESLARLRPVPIPAATPAPRQMVTAAGRQPNKTEELYNRTQLGGNGRYEAVTFRLPGGSRYTPDWVTFAPDGRMVCHEVKGSFRFGSQGRAATAFRECVAAFPDVAFVWGRYKDRDWQIQTFNVLEAT
jgi:hypothetical protein